MTVNIEGLWKKGQYSTPRWKKNKMRISYVLKQSQCTFPQYRLYGNLLQQSNTIFSSIEQSVLGLLFLHSILPGTNSNNISLGIFYTPRIICLVIFGMPRALTNVLQLLSCRGRAFHLQYWAMSTFLTYDTFVVSKKLESSCTQQ